jgi:hypothetical protein
MQKTTVYLDVEAYRTLKRIAARQQRPPAELVREAVAEFAARHASRRRPRSVGAFASSRSDLGSRAEELLTGMGMKRAKRRARR